MYKKYNLAKLKTVDEDYWFQEIASHIGKQVQEDLPFSMDKAKLQSLSEEVLAILFLDRFIAEAGGCGIVGYLEQGEGLYTPYVYNALKLVDANELLSKLESAIPMSFELSPEYLHGDDLDWFMQFKGGEIVTREEIDTVEVDNMINNDLVVLCNKYVTENIGMFAE